MIVMMRFTASMTTFQSLLFWNLVDHSYVRAYIR